MELSRLLRKPGKRNGIAFVPIVHYELEALTSSSRGRRRLRIWSFPGSYGNRGSGMEQASSDEGV